MNQGARQAFDDWKRADASARDAETRLAQAWETYFARRSEPPTRELIREVSLRRAVANDKLTTAMQALSLRPGDGSDSGVRPTPSPAVRIAGSGERPLA